MQIVLDEARDVLCTVVSLKITDDDLQAIWRTRKKRGEVRKTESAARSVFVVVIPTVTAVLDSKSDGMLPYRPREGVTDRDRGSAALCVIIYTNAAERKQAADRK